MGYRTTVILSNDCANEWRSDPMLGAKIYDASHAAMGQTGKFSVRASLGYGSVVECTHCDEQALVVIDSLGIQPLSFGHWRQGESDEVKAVRMLKEAARQLGYKLIKDNKA